MSLSFDKFKSEVKKLLNTTHSSRAFSSKMNQVTDRVDVNKVIKTAEKDGYKKLVTVEDYDDSELWRHDKDIHDRVLNADKFYIDKNFKDDLRRGAGVDKDGNAYNVDGYVYSVIGLEGMKIKVISDVLETSVDPSLPIYDLFAHADLKALKNEDKRTRGKVVVFLHSFVGLSEQEIADVTGYSESHIEKLKKIGLCAFYQDYVNTLKERSEDNEQNAD